MKHIPRETFQIPETADLVKIVPEAGQARFYHAALWPDLFGGVTLAREWGRIGQAGQLRLDPYSDPEAAAAALARLVRRKRRRGYREAP